MSRNPETRDSFSNSTSTVSLSSSQHHFRTYRWRYLQLIKDGLIWLTGKRTRGAARVSESVTNAYVAPRKKKPVNKKLLQRRIKFGKRPMGRPQIGKFKGGRVMKKVYFKGKVRMAMCRRAKGKDMRGKGNKKNQKGFHRGIVRKVLNNGKPRPRSGPAGRGRQLKGGGLGRNRAMLKKMIGKLAHRRGMKPMAKYHRAMGRLQRRLPIRACTKRNINNNKPKIPKTNVMPLGKRQPMQADQPQRRMSAGDFSMKTKMAGFALGEKKQNLEHAGTKQNVTQGTRGRRGRKARTIFTSTSPSQGPSQQACRMMTRSLERRKLNLEGGQDVCPDCEPAM